MSYLANDAINRVNIHTGMVAFAHGAGGIFFMAVLLKAGISFPMALVAMAGIFAGRFAIRPLILPFAKRLGLKPLLVAGTLGMAVPYLILPHVDGLNVALWLLIATVAIAEVVYFPVYHTYFATLGDIDGRGRQIAVREALNAFAGVVAPLLGAWALVSGGPRLAFFGVALIQAAAALPLIGIRNVAVLAEVRGVLRSARLGGALFALDGWVGAFNFIVWPGALFLALGSSYAAFGGAMALAGVVGAAYGLFHGHTIDAGRGRRAVAIACSVVAAIIIFRSASLPIAWLAVTANAVGAVVQPLLVPVVGAATYNLARVAPCSLRFNMTLEATWDIGCGAACLVAAALVAGGVPVQYTLLLALPSLAIVARLLWGYYAADQKLLVGHAGL